MLYKDRQSKKKEDSLRSNYKSFEKAFGYLFKYDKNCF